MPTAQRRDVRRESPWRGLRPRPPYVLDEDRGEIAAYNALPKADSAIQLDIPPSPFIGSYEMARVVILTKSPSWDDQDLDQHENNPEYANQRWQNLTFENEDFPFYVLNPAFAETRAGQWWNTYLKELVEACDAVTEGRGREFVGRRLFSIAFFPYHVNSYAGKVSGLRCQKFAQNMVSSLRSEGLPIIVASGAPDWYAALPRLKGYVYVPRNAQGGNLTKTNLPEGVFDDLVARLTAPEAE